MDANRDRIAPALKSYVAAIGLKQAELAHLWGITRIQVGRIVNCKSGFSPKHAKAFCREYGFPEDEFGRLYNIPADPLFFSKHGVDWKGERPTGSIVAPEGRDILRSVNVLGAVQAGIFTEAIEWPQSEHYGMTIPVDDGYPQHLKRYGLEVRGESMNRIFPAGSLVYVIDFWDLGRPPETGDYVTVLRRDPHGPGMEATIKALEIRPDGSACLWPQSTDPNFQQPLVIPAPDLENPECAGCPDIQIKALVIGSLKTKLKASF